MREHEVRQVRDDANVTIGSLNRKYQPDDIYHIKVLKLVEVCRKVMVLCDIALGDEELEEGGNSGTIDRR